MTLLLNGKKIVITGAGRGIGREIAWQMAQAGADILIHYHRSAKPAEQLAAQIRALGKQAIPIQADLAQPGQAKWLVKEAWEQLGKVDVWVNNAGTDIITTPQRQLPRLEKLQRLLDVDVRGTVVCSWEVGERMKNAGTGLILNIGWDKAFIDGMAGITAELFALSKAAVMGFSKSLARTLAPEVRVNVIAPGFVQTEWGQTVNAEWQERVLSQTPLHRWGQPADIAHAALFLASDQATFITGQIINVNGGVVA